MRFLFYTILFALLAPRWSPAEELISGVLAFDPPAFLSGTPSGGQRTNSENGVRMIRRYAASDNDPRTSQRLLTVNLREVGAVPEAGRIGKNGLSEDQALRNALQATVNSNPRATNVTSVTKAEVGGRAAWLIAFQIHRPYWQKTDVQLFPQEIYWVKVQGNQVAEIKLAADSPEHLQTLKACLPRFKFEKMEALTGADSNHKAP